MRKFTSCMVLFLMLNLAVSCSSDTDSGKNRRSTETSETDAIALDPICRMQVNKEEASWTAEHNDETYYFCNEKHKDEFVANPERYVAQN